MKGYIKLRKKALDDLNTKLSSKLSYHSVDHTLGALETCELYLKHMNIDARQAKLLRIGILFHDIGFTKTIVEHEAKGAEIATEMMSKLGFSKDDIQVVVGLILATKVPQQPHTVLEQIICDVDLDYLGRDDFYPIGNLLFKELKAYSLVTNLNDWNKIQIKFLEKHEYHTDFAIKKRQPEKEKRIAELKKLITS